MRTVANQTKKLEKGREAQREKIERKRKREENKADKSQQRIRKKKIVGKYSKAVCLHAPEEVNLV